MRPFDVNESQKMIAADGTRIFRIISAETHGSSSDSSHPLLQSLRESVFQHFKRLSRRVLILTANKQKVFIAEITARAFIIADSNKRRTLSRSDIAKALSKSDQFDFLIDVVPREDTSGGQASATVANKGKKKSDEVRFLLSVIWWLSHPPLVQPPSRDETGDQLEGDSQVTQALSLEHVCAFTSALKSSILTHPLRLDKFHAGSRIRTREQFLGATHIIQVVFCTSHTRQTSSMGVRCSILECRKIQNISHVLWQTQ